MDSKLKCVFDMPVEVPVTAPLVSNACLQQICIKITTQIGLLIDAFRSLLVAIPWSIGFYETC